MTLQQEQQPDIQVPNIQKIFDSLKDHHKQNQVSACLFNLIVYTSGNRRLQFLKEMVKMIIDRFPCRIFFIQADINTTPPFFHVEAMQEGVDKGDISILCDEINIRTSSEYLPRVPSIILPNLVPDLPIFLLWGEDPTHEKNIFPFFKPYASRLVFDAECSKNLQQFCQSMLKQHQNYSMDIMDLNWALISGWRKIFPQIFDTNQKLQALKYADRIKIYYNQLQSNWIHQYETQAIYLQGWLASSFNWTFKKKEIVDDKIHLHYCHEKGNLTIELEGKLCDEINSGAILGLELFSYENQSYHLCRPKNGSNVRVEISSKETCELPFMVALPKLRGFLREIFYQTTNEHYIKMIRAIEPIDWSLSGRNG